MKKIILIAHREFSVRIRNKTFLISTLLLPIGIIVFYGAIFLFSSNDFDSYRIGVIDQDNTMRGELIDDANFKFIDLTPGFNPNKLLNLNPNALEEESYSYLSIACANMNSSKLAGAMEQKRHFETLLNAQKENEKNGVQSEILDKDAFALIKKGFDDLAKVEKTIFEDRKQIFTALIESGADIELANEKGRTALFYCKDVDHAYWL